MRFMTFKRPWYAVCFRAYNLISIFCTDLAILSELKRARTYNTLSRKVKETQSYELYLSNRKKVRMRWLKVKSETIPSMSADGIQMLGS